MQSTHCWPTAADRRQSGQAGRPHRTHETYVSRSGCLKQVGADAETPDSGLGPGGASMALAVSPGAVRSWAAVALDHHGLEDDIIHRPVVPAGSYVADVFDNVA